AVGPRRAQEILDRVSSSISSGFYMLKNISPEQLAPFISHEHPQTIGLILSQLDPAQASGILAQLPERMQSDVAYRIATMENITPAVLKEIEEALSSRCATSSAATRTSAAPAWWPTSSTSPARASRRMSWIRWTARIRRWPRPCAT
ncbi:MAG: hypothetical protein ABIL09_29080, partial [Gemmatimonadota bacterium]